MQVFCTVSGAGSAGLQPSIKDFDVALVDEAAQLVEAEASIILAVRRTQPPRCVPHFMCKSRRACRLHHKERLSTKRARAVTVHWITPQQPLLFGDTLALHCRLARVCSASCSSATTSSCL